MKKSIVKSIFTLLFIGGISFGAFAQQVNFNVDTKSSKIEWSGIKESGYHDGYFLLSGGSIATDNGKLTGGNFIINVKDLKTAENIEDFEKHLKNADFFDVEKFPTAQFTITKVTYKDEKECEIEGTLQIKNVSNPIKFDATVQSVSDKGFFSHAYLNIEKSAFGITYGKGHIHEKVHIAIYLFGKKQ